ncbi:hypothetical protein J421_2202 [Gemmatirosa kalamazoonensis]|uniref:TonB-dependent receptor plug n=1 Tax=Gemmatirosa kalamazoonensis TaxID=861299 RepID=W0RF90_9BACT|nr:carboxypeptidase-like regulatory domain-containing protein [Gemmatirosa kalamazoonensis]AHG89739.1 hypothetical protein J421_2202 [Gemmatirosa kalamazoonensis]
MRSRRVAAVASFCAALALGHRVAGAQQSTSALGAVHGVVYDSLTRGRLARAYVQIVRADDLDGGRTVVADSAGALRIDSLAQGRYLVGFFHPLLDLLRVQARPKVVEIGADGGAVRVDLAVPDLARVRPVVCGSPQAPTDSSSVVAGRVRDAADGAAVANATVVLTWTERSLGTGGLHKEHRRVPVITGPGGSFVVCGVPAGEEIVVAAAAPGRASGEIALEIPTRGLVVRDLSLGDTTAADTMAVATPVTRGTARVTGVVRDSAGRAVPGARVSLWDAAADVSAGADGEFSLGGLPAGTRTLEVRAIGFGLRRVAIDLAPGRVATVNVRLDRAQTLAPVTILGRPTSGLAGFLERRAHNRGGRYITPADIARLRTSNVTDALRAMPGLRIIPDRHGGVIILGRSLHSQLTGARCLSAIYLDGQTLPPGDDLGRWVGPGQVAGIEVYSDEPYAPPQYRDPDFEGCSVLLVWTRRR